MLSGSKRIFIASAAIAFSACVSNQATPEKSASAEKRGYLVIAHGSVHHHGHHGHNHHGHHGHDHGAVQSADALKAARAEQLKEQAKRPWESAVLKLVTETKPRLDGPVEVAFGMWDHLAFQDGLDNLVASGVKDIRVIPLFVNSHSSVVRGQKFQFGAVAEAPDELPSLAKVHIPTGVRLSYGQALDESENLTRILVKRARELSQAPEKEELFLIAHGPVDAKENEIWLRTLNLHAKKLQETLEKEGRAFHSVHAVSLRDDAPAPVRNQATAKFRTLVKNTAKSGRESLVLPVFISSGSVDRGIPKRLEGLRFRYTGHALTSNIEVNTELSDWIVESSR